MIEERLDPIASTLEGVIKWRFSSFTMPPSVTPTERSF
jgi:hypothetical protein